MTKKMMRIILLLDFCMNSFHKGLGLDLSTEEGLMKNSQMMWNLPLDCTSASSDDFHGQ